MSKKKLLVMLVTLAVFSVASVACSEDEGFLKMDDSTLEQSFDSNGGIVQIPVNTNKTFVASVESGADWIHLIIPGMSVKICVDEMETAQDRTGTVLIKTNGAGSVRVSVAQKAVTAVSFPETVTLDNTKLSFSLTVTSAARISFSFPDWINAVDTSWTSGTKAYSFVASNFLNSSEESRSGKVTAVAAGSGADWTQSVSVVQSSYTNAAVETIANLWKTDPLGMSDERYSLLTTIEGYSNLFTRDDFQSYLTLSDEAAAAVEQNNPIMSIYAYAFDSVLDQVKNAVVEDGTARIWMLYNMGYIFKTPSACFGVDINHRYAVELEPYLDFICVTHSDADHKALDLMQAMVNSGKPVLSNFYTACSAYCSQVPSSYKLGDISISTCLTDESATEIETTTCYRINCGASGGGFEFMHVGDSNFQASQYTPVQGGTLDLLILRTGNAAEANILGTGKGQVDPDCIFLSHQIELRHYISQSPMRATILGSWANRSNYGTYSERTSLPFWGAHLTWKDGKLQ